MIKLKEMSNHLANVYLLAVESTPDAISCWDKNLQLLWANPAYSTRAGVPLSQLLGKSIRERGYPEPFATQWIEKLQFTFHSGQSMEHEYSLATPAGKAYYHSRCVPERQVDGTVERVLVITRDISSLQKAEQEVKQSQTLLQAVTNSSPVGMAIVQSIRDATGQICDFAYQWLNPLAQSFAGQPVIGQRMLEIYPHVKETGLFNAYVQAVENQQPVDFEEYYAPNQHWFRWQATKMQDGLFVTFEEISERKKAELEIKQGKDFLQSVFDTTLLSLSILQAVRDERGAIMDFQIVLVNKELARETGREDLVGKRYAVEYPGIKQAGLFDLMLRVMETGKPGQVEYYYPHEGFNKWYAATFAKMEDGLIASNLDITERKLAETELVKSLTVLKQAEAVAGMGSWEYDYTTGHFHWSAGMYRLFGLPVGSAPSPETYLEYVIDKDRPVAEKLVQTIRQDPQPIEETLRLRVQKKVITLKLKGVVLRDDLNQPYKLLCVDLDVSEIKRLEQENLKMRLEQQKALLLAILEAQEAERRRVSESLHNGVGQLLSATKLHLDQLAQQVSREVIAPTVRLLTEAIQETRRVSHELVPMVLQDFGLTRAMQDLCQKYQPGTLQVNCDVDLEGSLESYLELALYRISQELLTNVAKHAQATQVDLLLSQEEGEITLKVRDNGIGMNLKTDKRKGMGLRSIQDRIKLLNGTFTLGTPPAGQGTLVIIQLLVES